MKSAMNNCIYATGTKCTSNFELHRIFESQNRQLIKNIFILCANLHHCPSKRHGTA